MPPAILKCTLCPKECRLGPSQRGDCRVRVNLDGKLITLVYGKPGAVHVDPIEKKPMFHMLPGTTAFSIATAGCNLHCKFCQNWEISQANPEDLQTQDLPPEQVVAYAQQNHCRSIAYTYSEPIIYYEYTYETSRLAKQAGIKNILVTAGFINEKPLRKLCTVSDAANVDIKSFDESFYRGVCAGRLQPVLDCCEIMRQEGVLVEITNLIVPTLNDNMETIRRMCGWIAGKMGPDTPLHFSRFYPQYQIKSLPPTPAETLNQARQLALAEGLHFVYIGNVPGSGGEDTTCPKCGTLLIERVGYQTRIVDLKNGACGRCGQAIYGMWS